MLKYFVSLSFLLAFTEHAQGESGYSFNYKAGGWLKLHTAPQAWEEALRKCQRDGAVLASPLNKGLAHALQLQMLQFGVNGNIFIGTHDLYSKGHFVSVEGVPLSDMDIKWGPKGAGTGDCLTMSVDGSAYYSSCMNRLPFICYKKSDENEKVNECGTYDNEYHFNNETGSCYKVHLEKQTWKSAYSICAYEEAYLVILNDEKETRIVKDMFPPSTSTNSPQEGFYIGLVAWGKDHSWFTIHGESIDNVYNEWDAGEVNNAGNLKGIRGICRPNGKLNYHPDDMYPNKFVCEKSAQF